jgi:quinone-modifying oxidoreductase subunit QmoA
VKIPTNKNITVVAENAVTGEKIAPDRGNGCSGYRDAAHNRHAKLPADLTYNDDGFIINDFETGGMFAAGCANKPADVVSSNQNATGMALKAIQTLVNR